MKNQYDIYLTFSEKQVNADPELAEMIGKTVENLEHALQRVLRRKVAIALKERDFSAGEALKIMGKSTVFLPVLHPTFEDDADYQNELEAISKKGNLKPGHNPGTVFKLSLAPLKKALNPECLEELISYDFFEKNRYNRKIKSLSFKEGQFSTTLYGKLLDLAYDISESLKSVESKTESGEEEYIYVGLTTFDQQQARDEIRRELLHYGYKVLPSAKMPMTGEEFEKNLKEYLARSSIVIQLMGSQYGDILKGTKYSMPDFQNKVIHDFQSNQPENSLKRFIWIPQNNKISDQRQALYLKRIRRDEADKNTEIIESPLETFKTVLGSRIENANLDSELELDNISKVFLLTEEEPSSYIEDLYSALSLSGLKVSTLNYEEQTGIYARYLHSLRSAEAVIIAQQSENHYWLNSKLRDLIKSPGIGRTLPFRKVIIITGLLPDAQLIRMIKSKVEVLDNPQPNPDIIIQKLISE